ncbi:CreA family protein [Methyloprofundus sp.]|uniref:CreA family protein n=1 Tax=Methyloprofundus sp. TaxID=2020875 RepID=UPI003D0D59F8
MKKILSLCVLLSSISAVNVHAEEVDCVTTSWKLIGSNHKVCVQAYDDPKVKGVSCYMSQAKKGGLKGTFGLAEDPAQFSLDCRQTGKIIIKSKLPLQEVAFSEDTSLFFKETRVVRIFDEKRNTLVYLAISRKIIDGAPANSISTVPIMSWTK